jgi:hypothetical protein
LQAPPDTLVGEELRGVLIDGPGIRPAVGGDGIGGDFLDLVAADENVGRSGKLVGSAVEDADVVEEGDAWRGS